MNVLSSTRFNNDTWEQNQNWRIRKKWKGCIYGTPMEVKQHIYYEANMFVLEMNNSRNEIMGIGLFKNKIYRKRIKIYDWGNYNRYIYKGKYRLDKKELTEEEAKIIRVLEILLFKGSRHFKRGQGITVLPDWITRNKYINFIKEIKIMFKKRDMKI